MSDIWHIEDVSSIEGIVKNLRTLADTIYHLWQGSASRRERPRIARIPAGELRRYIDIDDKAKCCVNGIDQYVSIPEIFIHQELTSNSNRLEGRDATVAAEGGIATSTSMLLIFVFVGFFMVQVKGMGRNLMDKSCCPLLWVVSGRLRVVRRLLP
jgi:hypothetical protein